MAATFPDYADIAVTPAEGAAFPDYGDLLDPPQPAPTRAREGLIVNRAESLCRSCGQVHPYWTGTLKLEDGEEYCGVPILWSGRYPIWDSIPDADVAAPEHGMQVLVFGHDRLRLAIVWCPERAETP